MHQLIRCISILTHQEIYRRRTTIRNLPEWRLRQPVTLIRAVIILYVVNVRSASRLIRAIGIIGLEIVLRRSLSSLALALQAPNYGQARHVYLINESSRLLQTERPNSAAMLWVIRLIHRK